MIGNMQKGIALLRRAHGLAPDDESIHQYLTTALLLYEEQNSTQLTKEYVYNSRWRPHQ